MEAICSFRQADLWFIGFIGIKFTCFIESASNNKENRTVNFNLKNLDGRSPKNVQAILFKNCSFPVFPLNLTKTFPNLTALSLSNCGLTEISKTDFIGLEGLVELNLNYNKLQTLPSDLFSDMKKLMRISLYDNRIQYLDSKMFDGIKNQLEVLDLSANVNINDSYKSSNGGSIDEFMRIIESKCEKPVNESPKKPILKIYEEKSFPQKTVKVFNDLWLTRRFSDFTIVVGEAEFKVHKTVLAMQSEVLAALLVNEVEERKTKQLTIEGLSSAAVEDFLSFLYIGKIPLGVINATELFSLAAKFKVRDLKSIAEEIILNNIDESTALSTLVLANLHDSEVLMAKSFEFVKRAHPEITFNQNLMKKPKAVKRIIDAKVQHDFVVEEARRKLEEVMKDEV